MAKKIKLLGFLFWLVGLLASLAVGFGLTSGVLAIPYIPLIVMQVAGWIIIISALIAAIGTAIDYLV